MSDSKSAKEVGNNSFSLLIGLLETVTLKLKEARNEYQRLVLLDAPLKETLDHGHQAIVLLNEAAEIVFDSPEIKALLAYGAEEIMGQNAFDFFRLIDLPSSHQQQEHPGHQKAQATSITAQIRHKNG